MTSRAALLERLAANETPASEFVPYSGQLSPNIISTRDGDYIAIWRAQGIPHATADDAELASRNKALNELIRSLGPSAALWTHEVHRRTSDRLTTAYENTFCREFATDYYNSFDGYAMMKTELYVTLVYRHDNAAVNRFSRKKSNPVALAQIAAIRAERMQKMVDLASRVEEGLRPYRAERLGTYTANGIVFSEMQTFLGFLLNGEWKPIALRRAAIHEWLPTSRLIFGLEDIEIVSSSGNRRYVGMLDIVDYPPEVQVGALRDLHNERFEYVKSQSFSLLSPRASVEALRRQLGHMQSSEDVAQAQIDGLNDAVEAVVNGELIMGDYHFTLAVFGETLPVMRENCAKAANVFSNRGGFQAARIDLVSDGAWFAQLPCNWKMRPREAQVSSRAFGALWAMHNAPAGKRNGNPWGEAITMFKTPSGGVAYFNFHPSPQDVDVEDQKFPGHTAFIGTTGGGKTTCECATVAMALKANADGVFFDKGGGMEIFIRALGGAYFRVKRGVNTGLNPFQALEDTAANRLFLRELVEMLIYHPDFRITPVQQAEIAHAIEAVMGLDREDRRLRRVLESLPNIDMNGPHYRLLKWCGDGLLAWVFDNRTDDVGVGTHRFIGYDYGDVADDSETRGPLMYYWLHVTQARKRGQPFVSVIAEVWQALELRGGENYFNRYIKNAVKAERYLNALTVIDTQSPADILQSENARALVEQCVTKVFLPNISADADDYIGGFKLSRKEFDIVRGLGEHSRKFLVKQGQRSWVAQLDLGGLEKYLAVLSGTKDNVALLDSIRAEVGDDPDDWLPVLYERVQARADALKRARYEKRAA